MKQTKNTVLLVTGFSGAGMSTALKILEDLGYEVIDNLPIPLIDKAIKNTHKAPRPIAIGVDCRTRDFNAEDLRDCAEALKQDPTKDVKLVMITCDTKALQNRFSETRRRHPLAYDRPILDGIETEKRLLQPLVDTADDRIDTTDFAVADLRKTIAAQYGQDDSFGMMTSVTSFGFRNGVPRDADLLFDVRFLWNPHYDPNLKPLTGRDTPIQERLSQEDAYQIFFKNMTTMLKDLLPRYAAEGKSYLNIGIGCTGGRHRSVFVAEKLYNWLNTDQQQSVTIKHRDLDRWVMEQQKRGDTAHLNLDAQSV